MVTSQSKGKVPTKKECPTCYRMHFKEWRLKIGACFGCRKMGHRVKDCPNPKKEGDKSTKPPKNRPRINARVHVMTDFEVEESNDVVIGILLVNSTPAYVLFDCGVTHSFVVRKFAKTLNVQHEWLDNPYRVSDLKYNNCLTEIEGRTLQANLVEINMSDFNVILGMDWLVRNHAQIDCRRKKKVIFNDPTKDKFLFKGI